MDGVPVAAGLGVVAADHVAVGNIGIVPVHRGLGLGRALLDTILHDGRREGAHTAFLHASDETEPFFAKSGFLTIEHWTSYTAF